MDRNRAYVRMPEIFVFLGALAIGFASAEVFRVAYISGIRIAAYSIDIDPIVWLAVVAIILILLVAYALLRGIGRDLMRLLRSKRADLLFSLLLGMWANDILLPFAQTFHEHVGKANPRWPLLITVFFLLMIASSLISDLFSRRKGRPHQLYFLTDDEIENASDDVLNNQKQATRFAQTVVASGSHSGLVYGLDGPWGVGKTSFINLAKNYWEKNASTEIIFFKFEPLRYASDPDLAERLIRDLSAQIQSRVFVPEFRSTATRYSRMLKGKADFSFLGFKLAVEPSGETIDELLEDIDDVLKRMRRRLIVVIDDLDRLDAKAVNNVLFTVQRTFKLTQAAYILCYDTENLVASNTENERARQFLEKFINIKLSLFVDSSALTHFLRNDWNKDEGKFPSIPSDTMSKLASILSGLAILLEQKNSAKYMPLIGDMRKLKRFVNAMLLMQIEKTDLARTDFHFADLIHLMLLHTNYPGIFRRIYVEETEGRSGIFSIKKNNESGSRKYINADGYIEFIKPFTGSEKFLLDQLFEISSLEIDSYDSADESIRATRACFNAEPHRNLETYLKLIVRVTSPEPRETFKLYQDAVSRVIGGGSIDSVLSESEFDFIHGEDAHDQFWRILTSQSYEFNSFAADDAINVLVEYLPRYSAIDSDGRGLRPRSIYTLIRLLDRAGWGRTGSKRQRRSNTPESIIEIAHRIFGENTHAGHALINRLASEERGVLGWSDLILFRLQCSADRQGQNYNLQSALIVHDDNAVSTTGLVTDLAIAGMRTISQRIFALFKLRYIDTKRNLFDDVDEVSDVELLGDAADYYLSEATKNGKKEELQNLFESSRSLTKTFIVYQLANRIAGTGSGVGCGYYDAAGTADSGEISRLMNDYVFDVCFNPIEGEKNAEHFLNYCLCNLTSGVWAGEDEDGYYPTTRGLANELNAEKLGDYWAKYGTMIKAKNFTAYEKKVVTYSYVATYAHDLPRVFEVLDQMQS